MRFDPATIPARMLKLERDKRGYPIPFIVWRDTDGKPHFTINDAEVVMAVITGGLCSICGSKLGDNIWMIGGPKSAFHEHGAYIDPPVHKDCGTFALKTCPYIALPSYTGRIDDKTVDPTKVGAHQLFEDRTMIPERPPLFVFAKTRAIQISIPQPGSHYVHPRRPWLAVEYWQDGHQITPMAAALTMSKTEDLVTFPYWPGQKDKAR
jgi:hypothetical protein